MKAREIRVAPGVLFLGQYRIERRLGRGGMGEVWAAEDLKLERRVAIKLLQRRFAEDTAYVARFEREAKTAARLIHRNIAQIYTAGQAPDGRLYIVMQLVAGIPLAKLAPPGMPLDLISAVFYAIQVAEVLRLAHAEGIAHRDIKPENLIIAEEGDLYVVDFGIAQVLSTPTGGGSRGGEGDGSRLMGTVRYMAPELWETGTTDHRADFYALGVVLYEMTTGAYPYGEIDDGDETGLEWAHRRAAPAPLRERFEEAPEALWAIVSRLLAKDPEERYGDAVELIDDLRVLLRESVPAEHPVAKRVAEDRFEQRRKRAFAKRAGAVVSAAAPAEPEEVVEAPSRPPIEVAEPLAVEPIAVRPAVANDTRPLQEGFAPANPHALPFGKLLDVRRTADLPPGYQAPGPAVPFPIPEPVHDGGCGPMPPAQPVPTPAVDGAVTARGTRILPRKPVEPPAGAVTVRGTTIMARAGASTARPSRRAIAAGFAACALVLVASAIAVFAVRSAAAVGAERSEPSAAPSSVRARSSTAALPSAAAVATATARASASARPSPRQAAPPVKKSNPWGYD